MADYGSIGTLIENATREAIIAEMTCNGWDFENDNVFTKFENYGESSASQSVTLQGEAHASSYNGGASNDNDEGLAQAALNEFNGVKNKWETQMETAMRGWDSLPNPSVYQGAIDSIRTAVKDVATGNGNGGSQFGNPDLTEIGFIRERLPENSGQTINEFYRVYGPEKLELVFDGACEVMACLGVALTGEQEMLTKTREDVATLVTAVAEGFKQTRENHDTDWEAVITVATAGLGLIGAFGAGVPGLTAAVGAATATGGFLSAAMGALSDDTAEKTEKYTGSHPDTVYDDLTKALGLLDDGIAKQQRGHRSMLEAMTGYIADTANRRNFHIHPDAGLAPSFGNSDDIIDMKYGVLETIGYTSMPLIAKGFLHASNDAQAAKDQTAWYWPYASVPGGSIGEHVYGAYHEWESLLYAIYPLLDDNGAEVVRAGEHLAEAAGYVRDSDDWAREALGKDYEDIKNAGLGWQSPHVDPVPQRTAPGPGGRNIPI